MSKYDYIYRLRMNLSQYHGNIDEIIKNYETIIDEMLDEGLSMEQIIQRLGSPAVLADEIIDEFKLSYRKKTETPKWTSIILLICAIVFAFPIITIIITLLGSIFGTIIGAIGGVFSSFIIWGIPEASLLTKLTVSITSLASSISALIIWYFLMYWIIKLCLKFVGWLKHTITNLLGGL